MFEGLLGSKVAKSDSRSPEIPCKFLKTKACNICLYLGETFWSYHILNFWFPWLRIFGLNVTNVQK